LEECRSRAEQALAGLDVGMSRDPRREMKLQAALGASLNYTRGETAPETGAAWTKALEIAESLDDAEYQLRSLRGLWAFHNASGRYRVGLALAQRFHTLATSRSDPGDLLVGERLIGASQHYLGDQPDARRLLVAARVYLARVLWLQGSPDQAMRAAESSIEDARAVDHTVSLCHALAVGTCPIALLVGALATAERYLGILLDHWTRHALTRCRAFGVCHQGALAIKRGDVMTGSRLLRAGIDAFVDSRPTLQINVLLMTEALGHAGQVSEGLAELDEAIERPE
jgi:hypothetical protein